MVTKKIVVGAFLFTAVAFVVQLIVLEMTLRGLDLYVPPPTLFLAFVVPTMPGRLAPVPGGMGVTEASMVGFLTSVSALNIGSYLNTDTTVAAVAIFRLITIVIPAAIGAFVYFFFWKGEAEMQGLNLARTTA